MMIDHRDVVGVTELANCSSRLVADAAQGRDVKLETSLADRGEPLASRNTGNLTGLRKLYVGPKKGYRAVFAA